MVDVLKLAEGVAKAISEDVEVELVPQFDLKGLKEMRVIVVPAGLGHKMKARAIREDEFKIHVGVLKKCSEDELLDLVNTVSGIGVDLLYSEIEGAKCVSVEYNPLYYPDHFRERRQFTGVLELTFKEIQRDEKRR